MLAHLLLLLCHFSMVSGESYFLLIDAGSTGSRVHVFKYTSGTPVPTIAPSRSKKVKPGLSSFESNPNAAGRSLESLLEFAREQVPTNEHSVTPLHVQATAGLRSIDAEKAEMILVSVRKFLKKSGFYFLPAWAKIISGMQEGLNGWIATNYLRGFFHFPEVISPVGVVEMGGASMQFTFKPTPEDLKEAPEDMKVTLEVGSAKHTVYTYSYLGLGLQAVQEYFQHKYMSEIELSGNPCYPRGFMHSAMGDFERCTDLLSHLFSKDNCSFSSCSFNNVYQPPLREYQFVAIENFFYTTQFFGICKNETGCLEDLRKKGRVFCGQQWSEITSSFSKENPLDLRNYCFASAYLPLILERGFGFKPELPPQVVREINGSAIDWALGAVFYEIVRPVPCEAWWSCHPVLSSVFALSALGVVVLGKLQKRIPTPKASVI